MTNHVVFLHSMDALSQILLKSAERNLIMKKTSRFFALVLAMGLISVMLASCTKTPSDSNTFKAIAQEKGYTIEDALAQFSNYPEFKEVFIAYPSGHPFQIEFYVTDNADSATIIFNNQNNKIESKKGSVYSGASSNGKNYAKRTMTSDGKYTMVEYIENTLVYVPPTDSDNKAAIEEFLKELKY